MFTDSGYKEAHQIGVELADKLLEGKYSYVVSTHIDKGHVHNHVIFCAADNVNHEKYHDCKKTYYNIRSLSDDLCREHELSVITPGEKRGKTYKEWQSGKNGSAWKERLKSDIDEAIKTASTYEGCIDLIRAKATKSKVRTSGKKRTNLSPSALWTESALSVAAQSLWEPNTPRNG